MAYQQNSRGIGNRNNSQRQGRPKTGTANVFAPYNFIPFPGNPVYIEDENNIPGQNDISEKPESGEKLFSGEIRYTLESMTPVFVDDGTPQHRFCRNAAGEYMIPGSTMRGLVRSNAMILGLGNVRDEIGDYSLMYRNVANGLNKKRYGDILGASVVKMHNSNGQDYTLSVLKNVQAGYIEKTPDGKYVIYKTAIDPDDDSKPAISAELGRMNYYTVSERMIIEQYLRKEKTYKDNPDSFPFSFLIPGIQSEMMNQTAHFREEYDKRGNLSYRGRNNNSYIPYHKKITYKVSGSRNISEIKPYGTCSEDSAYHTGELVSTGFMQKKKVIYVVPEIDQSEEGGKPRIAVRLSDRDVRDFQIDYNRRKNSITLEKKNPHRNDDKKVEEYKAFFNLPEKTGKDGRKPVFYIQLGSRCYFGFTPRLRLFYDHTVSEGISRNHVKGKVDYIKAIFGYTKDGSNDTSPSLNRSPSARKSRVSFSDAVQTKPAKELPERYLTLSEPRPTDCLNYLDQSNGETSYNTDRMQLRGSKQYWLHTEADPGITADKRNKNLDSLLNPLDAGTCFSGIIRFKNLLEYELGLLLWSIRLEKNSWMNLGKGKSYGYGAMKLSHLTARNISFEKAYGMADGDKSLACSLFLDPYEDLDIDAMISAYKRHIMKYNGNRDIMQLPLIRDFFAMKDSTMIPDSEATKYMNLDQFQEQTRTKTPLPSPMNVIASNPGNNLQSSEHPGSGNTSTSPHASQYGDNSKKQSIAFVAGYTLSDTQKKKLEEMSGLNVVHIKEWPSDENIVGFSNMYAGIALPANAYPRFIKSAERLFIHAYQAVKSGKVDDGWKQLK